MRKIYLVKKNPELPVNGNNWIVMNGFEFMKFIQTPEGRERRKCFGQLDACSVDDVIIIAECGIETAKKWRSEKDSHDYLEAAKKKFGVTVYEAAAYSGIGADKLRELSDREDCEFVLWNGTKRLIKRKKLDEFLERAYSI